MKIIEITEHKMSDLYECAEKMLKYGGKVMNYLEEMREHSSMGHRGYGGDRHDDYGEREWEDEGEMGERRMRSTRYTRYR